MAGAFQNRPRRNQGAPRRTKATLSSWKRSFNEGNKGDDDFDEKTHCVICADSIEYAALSPCNHTTCHKCTFRQRALYGKKACLVCRTENEKLIFTEELTKEYSDFKPADLPYYDEEYGIAFTSSRAQHDTLELMEFRCEICRDICLNFKELAEHIRTHDKFICTICSANKKAFPCELKIYTHQQLQNHQTTGDEKGFNGHPLCRFCKGKRFYSEDELNLHLREAHEKCHVCDKIDALNPQYFKNYNSLEEHFKKDHFMCKVQSCLDQKFIVFGDEIDLQAHMVTEHGSTLSVVGLPSGPSGGRFQSQLSTFRSPTASRSSAGSTSSDRSSIGNNSTHNSSQDSMETKRMRFEERARHYLNYSTSAFNEFKALNDSFRNGRLDASALKIAYQNLFRNNTEDEIYLLIYDFAQIFSKNSSQNSELSTYVQKHEQITAQEHNFPALPGSSTYGEATGAWGAKTTKKAQKKSMEEHFPALPSAHSSAPKYTPVKTAVKYKTLSANQHVKAQTVKVNQGRSTYTPNYLSTPSSSSTTSSVSRSTVKLSDNDFPELPKAEPKKVIPRVNPIPKGNGAWDSRNGSPTASNSTLSMSAFGDALPDGTPIVSKGKGKKKKQILFSM